MSSLDQSNLSLPSKDVDENPEEIADEYLSVIKTYNTYYKYAYFKNKLGLIFKVNDGKIILTKVDSEGSQDRIEYEDLPVYHAEEEKINVAKPSLPQEFPKEDEDAALTFQNSTIEVSFEDEEEKLNDKMIEEFQQSLNQDHEKDEPEQEPLSSSRPESRRADFHRENEEANKAPSSDGVERKDSIHSQEIIRAPSVKQLEYSEIAFSSSASSNRYADNAIPLSASVSEFFFPCAYTVIPFHVDCNRWDSLRCRHQSSQ